MQTIIVYLDDAEHARHTLTLLLQQQGARTHWVLVACAPRMTHRISKWVSHSARENWRAKWADKLFAQVQPWLADAGAQVSTVLAKGPLPALQAQLLEQYGTQTPVMDMRRPKLQEAQEVQAAPQEPAQAAPATPAAPAAGTPPPVTYKSQRRWTLPGTLAGLGLMFLLAAD